MYTSTSLQTTQTIRAWQTESDPGSIWFGVMGIAVHSVTPAEAQQLIAELTRELRILEAQARAVAA